MGAGQSTTQPSVPPAAPTAAAPPPSDANNAEQSSGGMASFLPPPTVPGAKLVGVGGNQSRDSTSVLDSPTSCTGIFDQLWFCLSPVYQAREYYVTGDFDTCEEKASALYMCLSNKIKKDPHIQEKIQQKLQRRPIWVREGQEAPDLSPVWELKERPGWY